MSGYLSDWLQAEKEMTAALEWAKSVGCDRTADCPGSDHLIDCARRRHEYRAALTKEDTDPAVILAGGGSAKLQSDAISGRLTKEDTDQ